MKKFEFFLPAIVIFLSCSDNNLEFPSREEVFNKAKSSSGTESYSSSTDDSTDSSSSSIEAGNSSSGSVPLSSSIELGSSSSSIKLSSSSEEPSSSSSEYLCDGDLHYETETAGNFCDTRDSSSYKFVKIGTQIWMAQNLNYKTENRIGNNSIKCYKDSTVYCEKYGILYNLKALNINDLCPNGWHLPNSSEWNMLIGKVGGANYTGRKLKAKEGWKNCGPNNTLEYECEDTYGFAALPGGAYSNDKFNGVEEYGSWWSSDNQIISMFYNREDMVEDSSIFSGFFSVRCIKN